MRSTPPNKPTQPLLLGATLLMSAMPFAHAEQTQTDSAQRNVLPTITVKANKKEQSGKPTEVYLPKKTTSTKTNQNIQDVPQAVTTVTAQLLEDQQLSSLKDAMHNVSGLTFNAAEGGRSGDNMMLRGFYSFGDMYYDGIRDTAQYNRETFNLDQIDVLRGSAAMLFGRGQAGGVINLVSKEAGSADEADIHATIGQNDYYELKGEVNKAVGETSAVRVMGLHRTEGSWRSNPVTGAEPEINRTGLAISAVTGLGEKSRTTFNHLFLKTKDNADYGIRFDPTTKRPTTKFPVDYFWGIDANFDDSTTNISTLANRYAFDDGGVLNTKARYATYDRVYWASAPSPTIAPDADGNSAKTRKTDTKNIAIQSDYSNTFNIANMKHEVLGGIEYLGEDNKRWGLTNVGTTASPFYNKDTVGGVNTYKGDSYALFAQDSIEFVPNWSFLAGIRRDSLKADYTSPATTGTNAQPAKSWTVDYAENSYRTGLSFKPSEQQHYYLSYSDSFSPTADLYQISGANLPAETSKTLELGTKWLFADDQLAVRGAIYTATKDYERNTDLESSSASLSKKRRTNGIEVEVVGKITPQWEIFSGLAVMDAKVKEVAVGNLNNLGVVQVTDPRFKDQTARNTPAYTLNIWTTYKIDSHWKVGGGIETKGKRYGYSPSVTNADAIFKADGSFNPNTDPAYTRVDAMVEYSQADWALQLNVRNLLNKTYFDSIYDNGGFTTPGTERSALVKFSYKFK